MVGEIVTFKLDAGSRKGEERAAIVASEGGDGVTLVVFTNGITDGLPSAYHVLGAVEGTDDGTFTRGGSTSKNDAQPVTTTPQPAPYDPFTVVPGTEPGVDRPVGEAPQDVNPAVAPPQPEAGTDESRTVAEGGTVAP